MKSFFEMTADELQTYAGPIYCATAQWTYRDEDTGHVRTLYSDLNEPTEELLMQTFGGLRNKTPGATLGLVLVFQKEPRQS